jgi:hypothetical protein
MEKVNSQFVLGVAPGKITTIEDTGDTEELLDPWASVSPVVNRET